MANINTTGSHWIDSNGDHWSYSTQLTGYYKGHFFFNSTYYSHTTRIHQGNVPYRYKDYNHTLNHCRYGKQDWEQCIKDEIEYITAEVNTRLNKRKTQKNKETITRLLKKKLYLIDILNKSEVINEV